jgi:radical SAM superfamily enzyme YgiQ (UPF0313 family)
MRISIISFNRLRDPNPVVPIGAAAVAGALRAHGDDVRLLDLCHEAAPEQAILSHLAEWEPDLVGVSLRNLDTNRPTDPQSFLEEAERFVQVIKKATSSPILLGGSGYSLFPGEVLEHLDVPYGFAGEAEESVAGLIDCIEKGAPPDGVPGACYLSSGKAVVRGVAKVHRFSGLAPPAFDLLDCPRYLAEGAGMPIESKRGCDLACSYCAESADPEGARLKPPEVTIAEIERIVAETGTNQVFFIDGVFQYPPDHAMALCREMISRKMNVVWHTDVNPVGLSRELLEAMKEAGCGGVALGVEAASEEMLKSYRKGFTQRDIVRAMDDLRALGIPFMMFLLFGGPGETEDTVWRALDFLSEEARNTPLIINVGLRVYRDTPLEETARQEGRIAPGHNMLTPTYYLSDDLDEGLVDRIDEYCRDRPGWFTHTALQRHMQQVARGKGAASARYS